MQYHLLRKMRSLQALEMDGWSGYMIRVQVSGLSNGKGKKMLVKRMGKGLQARCWRKTMNRLLYWLGVCEADEEFWLAFAKVKDDML